MPIHKQKVNVSRATQRMWFSVQCTAHCSEDSLCSCNWQNLTMGKSGGHMIQSIVCKACSRCDFSSGGLERREKPMSEAENVVLKENDIDTCFSKSQCSHLHHWWQIHMWKWKGCYKTFHFPFFLGFGWLRPEPESGLVCPAMSSPVSCREILSSSCFS